MDAVEQLLGLAREHPLAFAKLVKPTYEAERFHRDIANALKKIEAGEIKRLVISMPPRYGKSELCSVCFPAWVLGRHPDWRIIQSSYSTDLARAFGRRARNLLSTREYQALFPGVTVAQDTKAADVWNISGRDGGYIAAGVGAGITGHGADIAIIDDPFADPESAASKNNREKVWEWYTDVLKTRLQGMRAIILIMCMTGDTPVLMADGTERPLRDIRPGDEIASYDQGRIVAATVKHHTSQGLDSVYEIRTKSGKIVRANERHPFLVATESGNQWIRLRSLHPGSSILAVNMGSGKVSSASRTDVSCPCPAVGTATATTGNGYGRPDTDHLPPVLRTGDESNSVSDTGSSQKSTTLCSSSRAVSAQFAVVNQARARQSTGSRSSALTTTTKPDVSVGFSAMTAISSSGVCQPPNDCSLPFSTYEITPDEILTIVAVGTEEVFDLEVEGTENFIANGLVSHNTRWNDDDLAGRVIAQDHLCLECGRKDTQNHPGHRFRSMGDGWTVLSLPALRGEGDEMTALWPRQHSVEDLLKLKAQNPRSFQALFQQDPTPDTGTTFQRSWFDQRYEDLPEKVWYFQSADTAFKTGVGNDYSVVSTWATDGADYYLVHVWRARVEYPDLKQRMLDLASRFNPRAFLIEDAASGQSIIQDLKRNTSLPIIPVSGLGSKEASTDAITSIFESGRVYLPKSAPWLDEWIEEHIVFPAGTHDDQVRTTDIALNWAAVRKQSPRHILELSTDHPSTQKYQSFWQRRRNRVTLPPEPVPMPRAR